MTNDGGNDIGISDARLGQTKRHRRVTTKFSVLRSAP
jgi:hypothetical protein